MVSSQRVRPVSCPFVSLPAFALGEKKNGIKIMLLLQDKRKTRHPVTIILKRAPPVLHFKLATYPKCSHTESHLTIIYLSCFTTATGNTTIYLNFTAGSLE